MLKRLTIAGVALTLAVMVPLRAEIIEQVVVKVNGEILTKTELEQKQVNELRTRPELANAGPDSPELKKAIAELTPTLILAAVDEMLLVQRGRELGYAMSNEQFKSVADNIRKENALEDEAKFQEALKQAGLTVTDLRRNLERQMLIGRVQQDDVMSKVSVNDEESKAYYAEHAKDFTTPAELMLREILIEVPTSDRGINVAQDDEAKQKIEDIRKRLLAGEPFARLAGEVSASASKANGGLIGPINENDLALTLRKILDALKIGELSQPLRTTRGYQLLKLESRTETKVRTFDEARDDISRRVAERKSRQEMSKYIERLREQATITWRNDELKKAYEAGLERRKKEADVVAPVQG